MPPVVRMVPPEGGAARDVPAEEAQIFADRGWTEQGATERAAQVVEEGREDYYTSPSNMVRAGYAAGARAVSGGISDAVLRGMGKAEDIAGLREHNAGLSTAIEIGASVLPVGVPGLAARAGRAIGKVDDAASALSKIGGAAKGAAAEGAILGAGTGVSEVALSKDPLTLERAISTIGSHTLFGGAVGGVAGGVLKGAGIGLRAAKTKLDDIAARGSSQLDEATGKAFADEVAVFRKGTISDDLHTVVKGAADRETRSTAKIWLEADKSLDRVLRNPKALAQDPKRVLTALQQQEHAIETVLSKVDDLKAKLTDEADTFAMSSQGKVARAKLEKLDKIPSALEKNRALQAKIGELTAKPAVAAEAGGIVKQAVGGTMFGTVAGFVADLGIPGASLLAPAIGGMAANAITGGIQKLATKQAARASKAIETFLSVGGKVAPVVPVLASKTLATARFSPDAPKPAKPRDEKSSKRSAAPKIGADYKARTDEIKSQTMYDVTGKAVMRPEARMRMATTFDAIRQHDPLLADKLETMAARKMEFLANKIPRKADVFALNVGPDSWQPSDMGMRAYARYVAAVEDPIGVVERLATGQITPEDAEAMREVYPEMFADIQRQIMEKLPTLQKTLPYQRRLALSIFSGVPVDAAMHPRILGVLQRSFVDEEGSEGGTQAPMPEPAFGSVKNQEATPSQQRQMT